MLNHVRNVGPNEQQLTMSDINAKYCEIANECNLTDVSNKQGKRLKGLIQKNLPDLQFIPNPVKKKSEYVMLPDDVSQCVSFNLTDNAAGHLARASRILRQVLLCDCTKWTFSGKFNDYELPSTLRIFLSQLLFGKQESDVVESCHKHAKAMIEATAQVIVHNTMTDRQVRHVQKAASVAFVQDTQTPLSVGLSLSENERQVHGESCLRCVFRFSLSLHHNP